MTPWHERFNFKTATCTVKNDFSKCLQMSHFLTFIELRVMATGKQFIYNLFIYLNNSCCDNTSWS